MYFCFLKEQIVMTSEKTEKVEKFLREHGISFQTHHHPPLPTIELALEYWKEIDSTHCKNLFFRNHKGNRHYLVVFECHKELGIHTLEKSLKQGKLSFASQERMERCLGLLPGSVSPFGLINDMNLVGEDGKPVEGVAAKELFENGHRVKLFLDKDLQKAEKVSFHPCDNTASTVISNADFIKFLEIWGGEYEWIDICGEKLVSIVIPAYNAAPYLDECLESCCRQDLDKSRYEIIIVNDGSTDRTVEIAERWAEDHHNIKVISQENKGLSMARNAGMDAAEGKYIMFVDSDDTIAGNCLEGLMAKCATEDIDMLRFCAADIIGKAPSRRYSYRNEGIKPGKDLLKEDFQVCAPFALYKKDFLQKAGLRFHPGIYHEDNEFTPRAYWFAEKVASVNDIVYFVRQTPDSITRTPNPKRGYDLLQIISLLEDFTGNEVSTEYRPYFHKQISDCINRCIRLAGTLEKPDAEKLYKAIYGHREIFIHMLKSDRLTHKIEGRLMVMFPKRMKFIYRTLDLIHR